MYIHDFECAQLGEAHLLTDPPAFFQRPVATHGKVSGHDSIAQGSESMLQVVMELVEAEHRRATAADTMAAAGSLVRGDGEGLLHRIVAYFQDLFSVPQMEGVLTAMSQVLHRVWQSNEPGGPSAD